MSWFERLRDSPAVGEVARRIAAGGSITVRGHAGSSTTLLAAALSGRLGRPLLLVVAHLDEADEALDELEALGLAAARFPALEVIPGETSVNLELVAERLTLVRRLLTESPPPVIAAALPALMQTVPVGERLDRLHRPIRAGQRLEGPQFIQWLTDAGYARVPAIDSPGEFSVRGGIIDIFPPGGAPTRLDLFGDEVEAIFEVDLETMGSDRRLEGVDVIGASVADLQSDESCEVLAALMPAQAVAVLQEISELSEQARSYLDRVADARGIVDGATVMRAITRRCGAVIEVNQYAGGAGEACVELPVRPLPAFAEGAPEAIGDLAALAATHETVVLCQNDGEAQRMQELLREGASAAPATVLTHYLHRGLIWDEAPPLALVPYHELLHRYQTRRRLARVRGQRAMDAFLDLEGGDYVVHRDHGIARFVGLQTIGGDEEGPGEEFLTLEFSGRARLHVPATKIELVQKYIGALRGTPELSSLGGKRWGRQKERVREAVEDLAEEMLRLQAQREALPGIRYPADTAWQREFEAEFPYQETDDQLTAIAAVKKDMGGGRPMDRLLCGDVGFGKTEIAIRAAFKAAEFGKQVAVLVPTTWLAEQHLRTFRERFADYPFKVESLSRLKTGGEQKKALEALRKGQLDIVIGTHRLLSADVKFADLGLVVIDEEQRFGVEHKQRLLALRATADVLTMTATPIPRTLHMAMLGLRDISSLTTPPLDRRAIVTEVMPYDQNRIRQGIARELAREGQVFFVHNRIHDIHDVADAVQHLAPQARIVVGHGQMPTRQLERVMNQFLRGEADILVSTTIIESGVDIPTVNTMFVNDAHRFGLSELHQLRGRVGRYKHRAYCYLLLDPGRTISPEAMKRLRALESFSMLGAGFKIALRDLEIRGAGNLLGPEQSGHIAAVGYEMYCQLLEQAVARLKEQPTVWAVDTVIDLGVSGMLPKGYIPSDVRRMDAYRRICQSSSFEDLEQVGRDLASAYGELPAAAERLLALTEIRLAATALGITSIRRHDRDIIIRTRRTLELQKHMEGVKGTLRLVGQADEGGVSEVYYRPPEPYLEADTLLTVLRNRLRGRDEETKRRSDGATKGGSETMRSAPGRGAARCTG